MFVALCRCELFIPEGRSLKAKRSVVHGLKERLRARFRASVAEVDGQDLHQRGILGIAIVGMRPSALAEGLAAMRRVVEQETRCQITAWETRIEAFGADGGVAPAEPDPAAGSPWDQAEEGDEFFGPLWRHGKEPQGRGREEPPREE